MLPWPLHHFTTRALPSSAALHARAPRRTTMEGAEMALPDDTLAVVLARLPARSLAACRCVCKAWCAVVDSHGQLLPHVLPHALHGIFINYPRPGLFFARPSSSSTRPGINDLGHYLPASTSSNVAVLDHCNGLLLYGGSAGREL
jgi:hypothetical protein